MQNFQRLFFLFTFLCTTSRSQIAEPLVVVHGGAEEIPDAMVNRKVSGVKRAAHIGYRVLERTKNVLDAVEEAVKYMESDECFNAGFGSALNLDGEVEMDASIMNGSNLNSGAVTAVKDIAHPINLARYVMEYTPHHMLAGHGATQFARELGIPTTVQGSLVSKYAKKDLENFKKCHKMTLVGGGSVGAIAIDANGHIAVAASSGGMIGKMVGRSCPHSAVGSGIYADDAVGAVSVTGHGESIARYNLAHTIIQEMRRGNCAGAATSRSLKGLQMKFNNSAGAIVVSRAGEVSFDFTTERMPWAYQVGEEIHFGVQKGDHARVNSKEMLAARSSAKFLQEADEEL